MKGVNADQYGTSVAIIDLDDFAHLSVGKDFASQTGELSDTMVNMHDIITRLELHEFLKGERHL